MLSRLTWLTSVVDIQVLRRSVWRTVDELAGNVKLAVWLPIAQRLQHGVIDWVHWLCAVVGGVRNTARRVGAIERVATVGGAGDVDGLVVRALDKHSFKRAAVDVEIRRLKQKSNVVNQEIRIVCIKRGCLTRCTVNILMTSETFLKVAMVLFVKKCF